MKLMLDVHQNSPLVHPQTHLGYGQGIKTANRVVVGRSRKLKVETLEKGNPN